MKENGESAVLVMCGEGEPEVLVVIGGSCAPCCVPGLGVLCGPAVAALVIALARAAGLTKSW